jgi:hypothetical protein
MLDGIEIAGFAPISLADLHGYAYLANLLSPLWDVDPLDGKVLKQGRPYYPELREALDRMIFLGVVDLVEFGAERIDDVFDLVGSVGLNTDAGRAILDQMDAFSDERRVREFLRQLALAVAPSADELGDLITRDVTWTDNRTGRGDVLDFAEWRDANYTLNATNAFESVLPAGMSPSRGEKLQYYVHLLERRAGGHTGHDDQY